MFLYFKELFMIFVCFVNEICQDITVIQVLFLLLSTFDLHWIVVSNLSLLEVFPLQLHCVEKMSLLD